MIEIRVHGRGGQGAVTASQILAIAAFHDGKHSQAFPNFGVERRGAPSTAFTRIDDRPINIRSQIYSPDIVLVLDASLKCVVDVSSGLKDSGKLIINTNKSASELRFNGRFEVFTADATSVALEIFKKDIVNTPMLGAFAAATKMVSMSAIEKGIDEIFAGKPELIALNKKAVREVYKKCHR